MPTSLVAVSKEAALSREQMRRIICLVNEIWPVPGKSVDDLVQAATGEASNEDDWRRRYVIWKQDAAIAHARVFPRALSVSGQSLPVLALAGVCVLPARQGEGLGKAVVQRVFDEMHHSDYPVILFQTGVPEFYRKLGCRTVDNRFFNSQSEGDTKANPWWEDYVMIYPAKFDFPEGEIDLNGPGY